MSIYYYSSLFFVFNVISCFAFTTSYILYHIWQSSPSLRIYFSTHSLKLLTATGKHYLAHVHAKRSFTNQEVHYKWRYISTYISGCFLTTHQTACTPHKNNNRKYVPNTCGLLNLDDAIDVLNLSRVVSESDAGIILQVG